MGLLCSSIICRPCLLAPPDHWSKSLTSQKIRNTSVKLSWRDSTDKHMTGELATCCWHYPTGWHLLECHGFDDRPAPTYASTKVVAAEYRQNLLWYMLRKKELTTILADSSNSTRRLPPTTPHPHGSIALKVLRLPFSTFVADLAACRGHRAPKVDARADMASWPRLNFCGWIAQNNQVHPIWMITSRDV